MLTAKIYITLKQSVLDPQGQTVKKSLLALGEETIDDIRIGKYIELKLKETKKDIAEQTVIRLCDKLLVNKVIENYTFEII